MTLAERWYFGTRHLKLYAKKVIAWDKTRTDSDETKWAYTSNDRYAVKAEVVKGVLTFTVHVYARENGQYVWKYRKYSIIDSKNDATAANEGDINLDDRHVIRPGRTGKYSFKK